VQKFVVVTLTGLVLGLGPAFLEATQLPLAPSSVSGATVTPAFEGWYENPDGTFNLSCGYYSRNSGSAMEIPIGQDNFIEPGDANNPDHRQWVGWGDRTVDEMAHAWVDVTYLEQEEYERLVAERAAKITEPQEDGRR